MHGSNTSRGWASVVMRATVVGALSALLAVGSVACGDGRDRGGTPLTQSSQTTTTVVAVSATTLSQATGTASSVGSVETSVVSEPQDGITIDRIEALLTDHFYATHEITNELAASDLEVVEFEAFGDWAAAEGRVPGRDGYHGWGAVLHRKDGAWIVECVLDGMSAEVVWETNLEAVSAPPEVMAFFRSKPIPKDIPYVLPD
jgi:hypothetical protein